LPASQLVCAANGNSMASRDAHAESASLGYFILASFGFLTTLDALGRPARAPLNKSK
jgi:hypothetical protein